MTRTIAQSAILAAMLAIVPRLAPAQAVPTATGAGTYTAIGGAISAFPSDYDKRNLAGATVLLDVQPTWHFGFEGEARFLRARADEGVDQTNYLAGVRVAVRPKKLRPYVKFLVGATKITAPFGYATGTFFTYAPGGGADCQLTDRIILRLADVEYQVVPQFLGSNVRNIGISMGLTFRLNGITRLPSGKRARSY